jgi:hypothetical protein
VVGLTVALVVAERRRGRFTAIDIPTP